MKVYILLFCSQCSTVFIEILWWFWYW